jgi:hypothetical protein
VLAYIYAFFLNSRDALVPFQVPTSGLIYIGSSSNLALREYDTHLTSGNTGFSTVRRSIGAILKQQLGLTACPRGRGKSATNFTNYCFDPEGDFDAVERDLIQCLRPILNLYGWPNPCRSEIKALRKACADEARQQRE